MSDSLLIYYSAIISAALMLSTVSMCVCSIIPGLDRWSRKFFRIYFSILILNCLFGLLEALTLAFFFSVPLMNCVLVVETLLLILPQSMLAIYLLHLCNEPIRTSRIFHIILGLWILFFVLLIISTLSSAFFTVTPDKTFQRGPLYPLLILPMLATTLITLSGAIRRRNQLSHKAFLSFFVAVLPMMVTVTFHMFTDVTGLIDLSSVVAALAMYGLILSDQIEQDRQHQQEIARQQLEIAQQRASIMVLQMRPHFIYNTLTTIYCLCNQDPQLARKVVLDFSTYLRKNFTAVASPTPVPFASELDHTRAYLDVEQVQYRDSLFVHYDTPHTWFRIPPLTLQPIVENAVKHGRDPYSGPMHISIQTRKTDSGSEIIVADNGRGYAPEEDGNNHIALKNIQQRLEIMCGGSLSITPNEGGGTVVTVTIPDSTPKE